MAYGYIAALDPSVSRRHVRFSNRFGMAIAADVYARAAEPKEMFVVKDAEHIDLYDRTDRIPFDKLEEFFKTNLK